MDCEVLWEVDCLSEVVFALHDVGQAFVGDVEEIDEGLHVAGFEQVGTDGLSGVVFMVVGGSDVGGWLILAQLIGADRIILLSHTIEESWRTKCFGWLLYRLYFFFIFLLSVSRSWYCQSKVTLHNSKLIYY